jgi:hypothetical protein
MLCGILQVSGVHFNRQLLRPVADTPILFWGHAGSLRDATLQPRTRTWVNYRGVTSAQSNRNEGQAVSVNFPPGGSPETAGREWNRELDLPAPFLCLSVSPLISPAFSIKNIRNLELRKATDFELSKATACMLL